jgi:protein TonB
MYEYQEPSFFSGRRGVVFIIVVILHALMGYGLASGLATKIVQTIIPPVEIAQLDKTKKDEPPPPPPKMEEVKPFVPPPEFAAIEAPADTTTAIAAVTTTKAPPPLPPPPKPGTNPIPDARTLKIGSEWYPDQSKRLGEEGTCRVELTVGVDGRVSNAVVKVSSGFPRLDEACIKAVQNARFKPGTEEGRPVPKTVLLPIKWKLQNN